MLTIVRRLLKTLINLLAIRQCLRQKWAGALCKPLMTKSGHPDWTKLYLRNSQIEGCCDLERFPRNTTRDRFRHSDQYQPYKQF